MKFGMKVVRSAMEGQVLKSVNIKEESNKIDKIRRSRSECNRCTISRHSDVPCKSKLYPIYHSLSEFSY